MQALGLHRHLAHRGPGGYGSGFPGLPLRGHPHPRHRVCDRGLALLGLLQPLMGLGLSLVQLGLGIGQLLLGLGAGGVQLRLALVQGLAALFQLAAALLQLGGRVVDALFGGSLVLRQLGLSVLPLGPAVIQLGAGVVQFGPAVIQFGAGIGQLLLGVGKLLVRFGKFVVHLLPGVVQRLLPLGLQLVIAGLLPLGLDLILDLPHHLRHPVVVGVGIAVQVGGIVQPQVDGGVDLALDILRQHKEGIIGVAAHPEGRSAAAAVHVHRVQHHAGDGELGAGQCRLGRAGVLHLDVPVLVRFGGGLFLFFLVLFRDQGQGIAQRLAGIVQVFLGHGDLARLSGQAALQQIGLVQAGAAQSAHLHLAGAALGRGVGVDAHPALRLFYPVQRGQGGHVLTGQPQGGLYADVKQLLAVKQRVGAQPQVPAGGLQAGEHGHPQGGDDQQREKSFFMPGNGAPDVFTVGGVHGITTRSRKWGWGRRSG